MDTNFKASLKAILREEGGNDDDPNDHGGRTSRGITQREYDAWRSTHSNLPEDVWQAPQDTVANIYHEQYWNPYCDRMPSGLDLVFFDFCVNAGRSQAVKTMQKALGIPADGMVGVITWDAIEKADIPKLIRDYSQKRRDFYTALAQFPRYGKGWTARANRIEAAAIALTQNTAPPVIVPTDKSSPKANPADKEQPNVSVSTATTGTVIATTTAAITDQLQQTATALSPLSDTFVMVKYVCIGITIICAGLAIYAVIKHKQVEAAT